MPHGLRKLSVPSPQSVNRRYRPQHVVRLAIVSILMAGAGATAAKASTRDDSSIDVVAPPVALLFAMAALGLFLGRRK